MYLGPVGGGGGGGDGAVVGRVGAVVPGDVTVVPDVAAAAVLNAPLCPLFLLPPQPIVEPTVSAASPATIHALVFKEPPPVPVLERVAGILQRSCTARKLSGVRVAHRAATSPTQGGFVPLGTGKAQAKAERAPNRAPAVGPNFNRAEPAPSSSGTGAFESGGTEG